VPTRTPVLDVLRPGFHALCRLYFGLELRGTEHIPPDGPLIIAPNHQTFADPPLVTIPVRRAVHYMAWSQLFRVPMFGAFIRLLRAFPVELDMSDGRAVREAARLLRGGEVLMIFPEGGRTPDGTLQPFKLGAFRLAVAHATPVLPVSIAGGFESWPPGRRLPRRGRVTITYHPPIRPRAGADRREAARELCDRTVEAIASAVPGRPSA
jgi:1-acyl-sn-glycerol-3-phosphate acyltransferase